MAGGRPKELVLLTHLSGTVARLQKIHAVSELFGPGKVVDQITQRFARIQRTQESHQTRADRFPQFHRALGRLDRTDRTRAAQVRAALENADVKLKP
jgi:hypothetical protein